MSWLPWAIILICVTVAVLCAVRLGNLIDEMRRDIKELKREHDLD